MDPSDEDSYFSLFLKSFNIKSVTKELTRIGIKSGRKGDTNVKITKIDHIIYQDDLDPKSQVFGCPYSGHKFLVASFNFSLDTKNEPKNTLWNYSEKNLNSLKNNLLKINFNEKDKFPNFDDKWDFFKDKVIKAIESCCPLKKYKNKEKDFSLWLDEELISAKKYRDYCHHLLMDEKNLAFNDFPESIQDGEICSNSIPEQVEMFNNFFTNVESTSFSTEDESSKYIFEKFKEFKKVNKLKAPWFSFKYFDLKEIDESLSELSNSSSPGYIRIHTKVLKAMPEIFSPILLKLCLELKKIPKDWKIAIVTPLYKNKGDKTKMDNYRAFSSNKIFFKGQHGFRNGFSCQTAIHEFISYINNDLDH
ncbi:unnamed protein product [Brachionus calyciflorus]|uniref:Uncharacterized protein n=1 Tax=Brachionus calyciflorus TaxID=104777 RepID=A0A814A0N9_9BILA|nr:unnamed protein product [Brachionus calyciflorus]